MNLFEGIRGGRLMKSAEGEKTSGGSESPVSEQSAEEGNITFTDGRGDSGEKPAVEKPNEQSRPVMTDTALRDFLEVDETQLKELETSIVREFLIISEELDKWSETLEKKDERTLYDKLYEEIERKRIEWNTLNDKPLEPGEQKDAVTEKIRLLSVFEDLRLIVNTMPPVLREAITKAQGKDVTEVPNMNSETPLVGKNGTVVGTTGENDHLSDEMIDGAREKKELYDFLNQPKGRETVDMLGDLITVEWQAFDQKVSGEVLDKDVFVSRNERARLWRMFFLPQMKAMVTEYLERYSAVPRGDSNKIFRALIMNLEESATRDTIKKYD